MIISKRIKCYIYNGICIVLQQINQGDPPPSTWVQRASLFKASVLRTTLFWVLWAGYCLNKVTFGRWSLHKEHFKMYSHACWVYCVSWWTLHIWKVKYLMCTILRSMYCLTPLNMRTKREFSASIRQRAAILTERGPWNFNVKEKEENMFKISFGDSIKYV